MMPFKYLMDVLRGRETRLDRIERRLSRIESTLCSSQRAGGARTKDKRTSDIGKIKVRRKSEGDRSSSRRAQKARTVHGPDGWHITEESEEGKIHLKEFTNNWLIEFDCPCCGRTSSKGVEHLWTEFAGDHTNYHIRLNCRHCGWESDEINIRGYK
ncbi:MAG: hypothetical protein ACLFTY_01655 [Candidatus Aenigmatarchaeota archaeon]